MRSARLQLVAIIWLLAVLVGTRAGWEPLLLPGSAPGAAVARIDPLLAGERIDVNTHGVQILMTAPGIGPATAAAIVAHRTEHGPFYEVDDLRRVRGIGPKTLHALAPYLTVGDVGPRPAAPPFDVNTATARAFEWVRGIGPVTAAAIVADRDANGPFSDVADVARVHGVGPKTVSHLRALGAR